MQIARGTRDVSKTERDLMHFATEEQKCEVHKSFYPQKRKRRDGDFDAPYADVRGTPLPCLRSFLIVSCGDGANPTFFRRSRGFRSRNLSLFIDLKSELVYNIIMI